MSGDIGDTAEDDDVAAMLPQIRQTMAVADDGVIAAVRRSAPHAITISRDPDGRICALLAALPLNVNGAAALVEGRLNPRNVDTSLLATIGEAPAAVYIWLLWAPTRLVQGLGLVDAMVRRYGELDGPLFSRPVNAAAARLHREMGFMPALPIYPDAPSDLMAIVPTLKGDTPPRSSIKVRVSRSMEDVLQAFAIRSATYMVEQACPYDEEFDGNDFSATHLVATVDGEPAACARIRWFGDFAKVERMAVRPQFRNSRVVFRLARFAIEHCRRKGFCRIYAHSRSDLLPLWRMFGFLPMPGREPFKFSCVSFQEVFCDLAPDTSAILFGADPMITNRPEGYWDMPGPLEPARLSRVHEDAVTKDWSARNSFCLETGRG